MSEAKVDSSPIISKQIIHQKEEEEKEDNQKEDTDDLDSEEDYLSTSTQNQALKNEEEEKKMDKIDAADMSPVVSQEFHTSKDQVATEEMSTIDRSMDSNQLATNAADKRAEYYGGKLKWIGETRPFQKTISTYNRIRGSGETSDQTLEHLSNALYSADVGFTYLFWRFFFGLKDITLNTYAIAQRKGLTRPPIIALGIVLSPIVVAILSPLLIGLSIFMVPALFFAFFFLAIPSMFLVPPTVFFIYMFGGMPKLLSVVDRFFNFLFGHGAGGTDRLSEDDGLTGNSGRT
ncbi:hypothetical protein Mgra_00005547 [Meloidogyne graminicola]|uniref:Uncharacterized protein n=1 Tax=Meloidogyne graminicola TaxID=189291 RepID=A0A8S9ZPW3_9BILA|nr:hypothetical protein Mgra_00005547 [Meloidogyne graminicola]